MMKPSKSDVIEAIKGIAYSIGRAPTKREFLAHSRFTERQVLHIFGSWSQALKDSDLQSIQRNVPTNDDALLADWGRIVRAHKRIPSSILYNQEGHFTYDTMYAHFGSWALMPSRFLEFANEKSEWDDVVNLIEKNVIYNDQTGLTDGDSQSAIRKINRSVLLSGRTTYGDPLDFRGLRHEPVNEQGVVFLFGMIARELGFWVEAIQTGFPDCEAKRQVARGRWQRVRIEFEYESRNFKDHGHSPSGCDIIVCWRHNWPACPEELEVLELQTAIKSLQ